ncbi:DUF397 domain-containing protein [Actinopolyspora saharensis]|uniref:DUF397 domain-containing protein n=1 Tax=Actinopolyspora saharensis TaxID=995062 RepID=A0A1H1FIF6_9ACTN|nr:DUF397 domain-containing protein [Actinopolyspora saharensis]SDR00588.1 protein of unknown function [Actinopolyspora saharensis]
MQHEAAHHWRTSSYSNDIGQCVEVALTPEAVGIRDTKDRSGGTLAVHPRAWAGFVNRLKTGEYDRG